MKETLKQILAIADRHFWAIGGIVAYFFGVVEFVAVCFFMAVYLKLDEISEAICFDEEEEEEVPCQQ